MYYIYMQTTLDKLFALSEAVGVGSTGSIPSRRSAARRQSSRNNASCFMFPLLFKFSCVMLLVNEVDPCTVGLSRL